MSGNQTIVYLSMFDRNRSRSSSRQFSGNFTREEGSIS